MKIQKKRCSELEFGNDIGFKADLYLGEPGTNFFKLKK